MTIGRGHNTAVRLLLRLSARLEVHGCCLQVQGPISLPPHDEPEPDGAIVVGDPRAGLKRHPGAGDVTCVIEVADSSLGYDRTTKLAIYARSGIPQYAIVNLVDGQVEVFEAPIPSEGRYERSTVLRPGDTVSLRLPMGALDVAVREILP